MTRLLWLCLALAALLCGCEKAKQDMYDQARYKAYASSPLWADGTSARTAPAHTVVAAVGDSAGSSSGRQSAALDTAQPALTPALLRQGQQRYDIFCAPCHSVVGDGDGYVVRRGFPRPQSLHSDRLRQLDDASLYRIISDGYGVMLPFASRLNPQERWATVAYIRALQLSQHASVAQLPPALRQTVEAAR
ncbi:c-type cytochrome [Amantichitinum ursilacus]|uniref:Cytochrome c domain-containing protein n=1 Tax=Amantichitinum ursilacus TaxID=857265 RepID=A0A0N0GLR9_9NEIS|nr:cytochrome c [Amantichitinum ursilacus]KPC50164.1 hypothetical protein WG78_18205 [Amantichitinum ursilacus]